jgi:hypothetical protein
MTKKRKSRRRKTVPARYLPKGWDMKRVREVAAYYDNQSDDDAIAEAEAAYNNAAISMMAIPIKLVPAVQQLIRRRRAS